MISAKLKSFISTASLVLLTLVLFFSAFFVKDLAKQLPSKKYLLKKTYSEKKFSQSLLYDKNGLTIDKLSHDRNLLISIEKLPNYVLHAFLSAEDKFFFEHSGINFISTARAFIKNNYQRSKKQGASTITQQLARLLFLNQEKTYTRKVKELILAFWLERKFSKNEILEMYLNKIFLGNHSYGIETAANNYFDKSASKLTLGEAALLAGLSKAPSYLAPHKNYKRSRQRQKWVLNQMLKNKYISKREFNFWINNPVEIKTYRKKEAYSSYIKQTVSKRLKKIFGPSIINQTGLKIYTTYDLNYHNEIENKIRQKHQKLFQRKNNDKIEHSYIIIEKSTGALLALQGGLNFKENQFNRAFYTKRELGALYMPIYMSLALDRGYHLMHPIDYDPFVNPSLKREKGQTLYETLIFENLFNSISLYLSLGSSYAFNFSQSLGFSFKNNDLSLAFGSGKSSLLQVLSAYTIFFNQGYKKEPYFIEKVLDVNNKIIYQRKKEKSRQYISSESAYIMKRTLQDYLTKQIPQEKRISGMLGQSSDYHNSWFIGMKDNVIAGMWIGSEFGKMKIAQSEDMIRTKTLEFIYDLLPQSTEKNYPERKSPTTPLISYGKFKFDDLGSRFIPFKIGEEPTTR